MPPSLKQRLLTGGIWVLVGKVFTAGASLLLVKLLTTVLSKGDYGSYELAFKLVTGGVLFAQFGLHQVVVRVVAESLGRDDPSRARAAIGVVYRLVALGAAFVAAGFALGGVDRLSDGELGHVAPLIALWLVLQAFQVLNSETFRGFKSLGKATLFGGVITGVVQVAVIGALALSGRSFDLATVLSATLVAFAISLFISAVVLLLRLRRLPRGGVVRGLELAAIGGPLWVNGVVNFFQVQSDLFFVNAWLGDAARGDYAAAARLVAVVTTSLGLVNLVVPPFIADLYARGDRERLQRILRNAATLAGVPALVILAAYIFFGAPILALVTQPEFVTAAPILTVLSIGRVVNVLTGSCGLTLAMTGHQRPLMWITVTVATAVVALGALAASRYDAVAVAWVYSGGMVVHNLWMWWATRRLTGLWTHVGWPRLADLRTILSR